MCFFLVCSSELRFLIEVGIPKPSTSNNSTVVALPKSSFLELIVAEEQFSTMCKSNI